LITLPEGWRGWEIIGGEWGSQLDCQNNGLPQNPGILPKIDLLG